MKKKVYRSRHLEKINYADFDKMKKEELSEMCRNLGRDISNAKTKKDFIEILKGE